MTVSLCTCESAGLYAAVFGSEQRVTRCLEKLFMYVSHNVLKHAMARTIHMQLAGRISRTDGGRLKPLDLFMAYLRNVKYSPHVTEEALKRAGIPLRRVILDAWCRCVDR